MLQRTVRSAIGKTKRGANRKGPAVTQPRQNPTEQLTRRDAYQRVTDQIVTLLDQGTIPWQRPWTPNLARGQRPLSITGHFYRGVNRIILGSAGYSSPVWLTFHQAQLRGAHVMKGEQSWPAVFYRQIEVTKENANTGEDEQKRIPLLRIYPVFNAAQIEGLELPKKFTPQSEWVPTLVAPQSIVEGYKDSPSVAHTGGDRAYYRPSTESTRRRGST
jgi:antirestriction protein ArdC